MFNKPAANGNAKPSGPVSMPNHINSDTLIEGTIKATGNLRIDGTLKGVLECKGRVVVGPSGRVEGEVRCENAEVEGTINANIHVSDLLSLKSTAKLNGDIVTKKLSIEPGAVFAGSCSMGGAVIKDLSDANRREESALKQKTA